MRFGSQREREVVYTMGPAAAVIAAFKGKKVL
jgi:hypothetical protein